MKALTNSRQDPHRYATFFALGTLSFPQQKRAATIANKPLKSSLRVISRLLITEKYLHIKYSSNSAAGVRH